jgi:HPt (histidine-containing phosphotransfer) domain-containing protein
MASKRKTVSAPNRALTLDRAHLTRYTMQNRELEREIIALFLQQLPTTSAMLTTAENEADWKLAVHTLKGSAAAIGALHINALASELEEHGFGETGEAVQRLLAALDRAFAEFRRAVARIRK